MGPNGAPLARETDEEACTCHSPDRIACDLFSCLGTNEIVTQERQEHDRACRQLRTDRPDGGRQAGLLDEVRQSAATAATAPAASSRPAPAPSPPAPPPRNFRLSL